jgi:formylglycine-generating enzyme
MLVVPTQDFYQILQVAPEADPEVIQAAYRALVKRFHPDTGGAQASNEKMKELNEAYAVLSNAVLRQDYDEQRRQRVAQQVTPDARDYARQTEGRGHWQAADEWLRWQAEDEGRKEEERRARADRRAQTRWAQQEQRKYEELQERKRQAAERKAQTEAKEKARKIIEEERRRRDAAERAQREITERGRRVRARENEVVLTLATGVDMILKSIPAGEFRMGSSDLDKAAREQEKPQHIMHLDAYLIGQYPVTVAQFAAFVEATGYRTTAEKIGSGLVFAGAEWKMVKTANWRHPKDPWSSVTKRANHPVTQVSWDDAGAFCRWVSELIGVAVRLPTEAEWEKAARGTDSRLYPWGDDQPDTTRCNFNQYVKDTTPVGRYSPFGDNPYNCADMAGNVWEWTSSLYMPYPYRQTDGREEPGSRASRALRGGGFFSNGMYVRCACRAGPAPDVRNNAYGFRVCATSFNLPVTG